MRELKLVQCDPSWGVSAAPVSDDDLFTWHCNVAGHPPGGGAPVVLHIELTFPPDYPSRPPKVEIMGSTVRHPNVFSTFICLDMLEGGEWAADEEKRRPYCGWSSAYSILAILRQLQTFFFEGDGTQWWDCAFCTLRNPIKLRRCDACEQPRGSVNELTIEVEHHADFHCRCGHAHKSAEVWPPFPDPINCDDAPTVVPLPDHPDDACAICLGQLGEAVLEGPLRGALGARPLAQLVDTKGSQACSHWFHLPCIQQLETKDCPLCRKPFADIVVRTRDAPPFPSTLERDLSVSSVASHEALRGSARARMTRLAEWPLNVVINIMACMRRPDRATLASAIPVWREAVAAPIFWEAQELQCFHEKVGPHEDTIGIGVHAGGTRKLSTLTAHFDAVSLTAWQGGLRQAAWKEPMTHWLPLFVNHEHAANSISITNECLALLADCAPTGDDSHLPKQVFEILSRAGAPEEAVNAVIVLPEMMHQLLKQVLDGDRHASAKVLKGYFVLHRLFLHFCDEWPAIREAADAAIRTFAESPDNRSKSATPWIAYILQLLTVSNVGWDDIKNQFVEEVLARNVQFTKASFPNYRPIDPDVPANSSSAVVINQFSEWLLFENEHGTDVAGTIGAREVAPGSWCGRPTGWSCLAGAWRPTSARHAFSVKVGALPAGAVLRIGWSDDAGSFADSCTPFDGWFFYAAADSFGGGGWFSSGPSSWTRYGRSFEEGDLLTACIDRGVISFRLNQQALGNATYSASTSRIRPVVALKRGAEVQLMASDFQEEEAFATPEQLRNMAWEARLNRRGNTLVLFQVFFISLVRPRGEGTLDWDQLKREYDRRLGFPSPEMSSALMQQFGEVHRIVALRGTEGWPLYFEMLGFPRPSDLELDRMLFKAFQRATALSYKMPGRRDHA